MSRLGRRAIDRRTATGKALAASRTELLDDPGGIKAVSTHEQALVEDAVKTKLILESVDAWLLAKKTLINRKAKWVFPAIRRPSSGGVRAARTRGARASRSVWLR